MTVVVQKCLTYGLMEILTWYYQFSKLRQYSIYTFPWVKPRKHLYNPTLPNVAHFTEWKEVPNVHQSGYAVLLPEVAIIGVE